MSQQQTPKTASGEVGPYIRFNNRLWLDQFGRTMTPTPGRWNWVRLVDKSGKPLKTEVQVTWGKPGELSVYENHRRQPTYKYENVGMFTPTITLKDLEKAPPEAKTLAKQVAATIRAEGFDKAEARAVASDVAEDVNFHSLTRLLGGSGHKSSVDTGDISVALDYGVYAAGWFGVFLAQEFGDSSTAKDILDHMIADTARWKSRELAESLRMASSLHQRTVRLAYSKPELRPLLLPLLRQAAVEAELDGLKLSINPNLGTATVSGTGDADQLAKALTRFLLPKLGGVGTRNIPKPPGKMKVFNFHWSNAQAAWDVIVAPSDMSFTDGSEFVLFCPLTSLSPLERPWSLVEMRYVAKKLGDHPGFASSMESGQRRATDKAAFGGTRVAVKDLPASVKSALSDLGYGRRDIEVSAATTFSFQSFADDGKRDFTCIVNMETGQSKTTKGSFGGPNPYTRGNLVDSDDRNHPIPLNAAIIQGSEGGGRPVYATIKVHPDNMATLIPAQIELSREEKLAITILDSLKPGYRGEYFQRYDLGLYKGDNPLIKGLVDKGLVKVTGTGIQITTAGKNARDPSVRV